MEGLRAWMQTSMLGLKGKGETQEEELDQEDGQVIGVYGTPSQMLLKWVDKIWKSRTRIFGTANELSSNQWK